MKKVLFSLLVVVFALTSCGGPNAIKFNDAIVKANNELGEVFTDYSREMGKLSNAEDFSKMVAISDTALAKLNEKLEIVKNLEAPKSGEEFKAAAIEMYEYCKVILETGKKFATLTEESSVDEYNKILKEFNDHLSSYDDLVRKTRKAQAKFAEENNFRVI